MKYLWMALAVGVLILVIFARRSGLSKKESELQKKILDLQKKRNEEQLAKRKDNLDLVHENNKRKIEKEIYELRDKLAEIRKQKDLIIAKDINKRKAIKNGKTAKEIFDMVLKDWD